MNHTPYLEIIFLLALSCPSAFAGLAAQRHYQKDGQWTWHWSWLFFIELLLLLLAVFLFPVKWQLSSSAQKSWFLVLPALLFTLGGEILFLFKLEKKKSRFWVGHKAQHWSLNLFFLLAMALFEELLYRALLPQILQTSFSLTLFMSLLISNFFFALIHCYQGGKTLFIKFLSGLAYAILFWLSKEIMLSITAHMLHNLFVVLFKQLQKSSR